MMQGRKAGMLPYGRGCGIYPDCFTCPMPDCVSHYGANKKEQKVLFKRWKPYLEMKFNRAMALGGKR